MIETPTSALEIDSSKIADYLRCPRRYFYRHILGWQTDSPNINLVFGEAWHRAKEHIFINGVDNKAIEDAMICFLDYYREYFGEANDLDNVPKDPGSALNALLLYAKMYGDPRDEYVVVPISGKPATEIYGTVPIGDKRILHFRLDAITQRIKENSGLIRVWDHKTSGSNSPVYQAQWSTSFQMCTYYHAVNCLYTPERVYDLCVDLSIFRKGGNDHLRIPIRKTVDMMSDWLWLANHWYDRIEADVNRLQQCVEDHRTLYAFPKNDEGCIAYNMKCAYFDFCISWPNPLQRCGQVPVGFKKEYWNPAEKKEGRKFMEVITK